MKVEDPAKPLSEMEKKEVDAKIALLEEKKRRYKELMAKKK